MRHTPATVTLPSNLLDHSFLNRVTPAQSAPPSIAQYSAGLAHDARNMLAAMDIYCELLSAPGVLQAEHQHFLSELRLLRDSSGQLLDRLLIEALRTLSTTPAKNASRGRWARANDVTTLTSGLPARLAQQPDRTPAPQPVVSIRQRGDRQVLDVAAELQTMLPMLTALAGPKVVVTLNVEACPGCGLYMTTVDFTRTLINLVRNATEAMSAGGRISISAVAVLQNGTSCVLLSIEDNGPGIPLSLLERIFETQVPSLPEETTRQRLSFRPRGLGLRIVREFVQSGHGTVRAVRLPDRGSRFEIVLPVVTNIQPEA